MKLLGGPTSPFVRKVRIAALELGLGDRMVLEPVPVAPTKPNRDYGASTNPLRKIPALITDDGTIIHDSKVICDYIESLAGRGSLVPVDGPERWAVLTAYSIADGMCEIAVGNRYETTIRPADKQWDLWIEDQWDRIRAGLAWFESRPETIGGPLNIARISLACLLGYLDFRFAESGWREGSPALAGWFSDVSKRPSLATTAPTA